MTILPSSNIIDGVLINAKKSIHDERGYIQHYIRCDDKEFSKFGEIYFSSIYNGTVKAWHIHTKMTLNYLCVFGMIKLVLYDDRENSPTKGLLNEFFIGEKNNQMITIPSNIWNGFKGYGEREFSIVANFTDFPHDKEEISRTFPNLNPKISEYDWSRKDG